MRSPTSLHEGSGVQPKEILITGQKDFLGPDPAEATGLPAEIALAFKDTYRMLNQRIGIFTSLPLRSLDRLSLQNKLKEIGRMEGATGKAVEPT